MKRLMLAWLGLPLAAWLTGCASHGPGFDAHAPRSPEEQAQLLSEERKRVASLESNQFEVVEVTNVVKAEWLKPPTNLFRLGPTDVIEIETLGEASSRVQSAVGPDGKIYYGLLPGVFVWGLTLAETRDLLEKEMSKYLRVKPEMTVTLRTVGSQRVWVMGSVQNPGVYTMRAPMRVIEAVAQAGGPLADPGMNAGVPNLDYSFLLREGVPVRLDFARLIRNGDLSQNIYLQPDDFLYLRPGVIRNIYVLGAVRRPTVISTFGEASASIPAVRMPSTVGYRDQTTLAAAIAAAGGTAEYAQRYKIAVVRGSLSNPRIAAVDLTDIMKGRAPDVTLEPGDIVYVPYVPWYRLGVLAQEILGTFVQTWAANEGYNAVVGDAAPIRPSVGF
jgi:protein involved in polysaccharide export with SLBB domain